MSFEGAEAQVTVPSPAGWRAELAPDDKGVDELGVPVYCPACWQREFGDAAGGS